MTQRLAFSLGYQNPADNVGGFFKRPVGYKDSRGYTGIMIDGVTYKVHRLAFFYFHKRWPIGEIDHINRDTSDNRIANLREVDHSINQHNRTTAKKTNKAGFLGVCRYHNKYRADIQVLKKRIYLGLYESPEIAHAAYIEAKRRYRLDAPESDSAPLS